jgi:hypothetical protein
VWKKLVSTSLRILLNSEKNTISLFFKKNSFVIDITVISRDLDPNRTVFK